MWIMSILPEAAAHTIFILGFFGIIAGFVLGFIPVIKRYIIPIKIISLIVFTLGVYLEGGISNEKKWQLKVKEMEAQMAELKAKGAEKNVEIQTKVIEKTKVVKEKGEDIIKFVDREVVKKEEVIKYIENCPVPKDIIDAHNAATEMNKAVDKINKAAERNKK
jgi:hypothetical protein